jgi:hypothetical protein
MSLNLLHPPQLPLRDRPRLRRHQVSQRIRRVIPAGLDPRPFLSPQRNQFCLAPTHPKRDTSLVMGNYNTNLAAEFYTLSVLHRLGFSATLTLGNKKAVDIVVARDAGDAVTIDVKGLAGKTNWPVDNLPKPKRNHFIAFVSFLGKIEDPSVQPEVYLVPSTSVPRLVYRNPKGNRRVIQLHRARKRWQKYRNAWALLR